MNGREDQKRNRENSKFFENFVKIGRKVFLES